MNIFSVLCQFTTILSYTTSYVLLAANMEDFRTLAKQFVPDSVADEILKMAKTAIERDKTEPSSVQHFRNDSPVTDTALESYEEVTVRSKSKRLVNKPRNGTTSRYELTLDDLVEKVKQRLQSELALMAATAAKKKAIQHDIKIPSTEMPSKKSKPNNLFKQETSQPLHREKSHATFVKQPSEFDDNKSHEEEQYEKKFKPRREKQIADKRYVAEMFEAKPPKYLYDLGKPVTVKPEDISRLEIPKVASKDHQVRNKQNIRPVKRIIPTRRRITTSSTTEAQSLFKGVQLMHTNDSYEDYIIPKKDEAYDEPETEPPKYKTVHKNPYIQRPPLKQKNKEVLDVFSDEYETTTKANDRVVSYDDETINYNKKKRVIKNVIVEKRDKEKYFKQRPNHREVENSPSAEPLAAVNNDHKIYPYEEQLQEPENAEEVEQPVTEELKARSEIISYNDNSNSQYLAPDIIKNNDRNKNKKLQKPKLGTVIPKRDGYKMSSPNYLVELPIVGEKYHFDEPIPENDRVPEKLEPMKNLKSIINGKVVLL